MAEPTAEECIRLLAGGQTWRGAARALASRSYAPESPDAAARLAEAALAASRLRAGELGEPAPASLEVALRLAAGASDVDLVDLLVRAGADAAAADEAGRTALAGALDRVSYEPRIVRALIEAAPWAADVLDAGGESALHVAIRRNHTGAVKRLLEAGADPLAPDGAGRTARQVAEACGSRRGVMGLLDRPPVVEGRLRRHELQAALEANRAGKAVTLAGRDLGALDLRGLVLPGADLRGCRASGQDLRGADLRGARLDHAQLSRARFTGARLDGAVLDGAALSGCRFDGARLAGAAFRKAVMARVSFRDADLTGADFRGASVHTCTFRGADVAGARFEDAWLEGSRLDWAAAGARPGFAVRKVSGETESEGPDYFTRGEFEVLDQATGEVVARFPWSLEEPYLTGSIYSGPEDVRISEDGTEAVARFEDGREERVLLRQADTVVEVAGLAVGPDADLDALCRQVIARPGETGGDAPTTLARLYERLGRTPRAGVLARALADLILDPDPARRAAALAFFARFPEAPGNGRLLDALRGERGLFPPQPASDRSPVTLDDLLMSALSRRVRAWPADEESRDLARAEAKGGGRREDVLLALIETDAAWVMEHLDEIARGAPERWQELVYAFYASERSEVGDVAARLRAGGFTTAEALLAFARKRLVAGHYRGLVEDAARRR